MVGVDKVLMMKIRYFLCQNNTSSIEGIILEVFVLHKFDIFAWNSYMRPQHGLDKILYYCLIQTMCNR